MFKGIQYYLFHKNGNIMFNAKKIEEIAKQVNESIPPSLKNIAAELENKTKHLLQQKLAQLDFVTREEFDVQTQVLIKTREKISQLEQVVTRLEVQLKENGNKV